MKRAIIIDRPARADIGETDDWYKKLRPGLQADFRLCLEQTLHRIQRHPEAYPIVARKLRRVLLPRFPYSLYYRDEPELVRVVAVFHTSATPMKWDDRKH